MCLSSAWSYLKHLWWYFLRSFSFVFSSKDSCLALRLMMVTKGFWYILGIRKTNYSWRCQCSVFFINSLSPITLLTFLTFHLPQAEVWLWLCKGRVTELWYCQIYLSLYLNRYGYKLLTATHVTHKKLVRWIKFPKPGIVIKPVPICCWRHEPSVS